MESTQIPKMDMKIDYVSVTLLRNPYRTYCPWSSTYRTVTPSFVVLYVMEHHDTRTHESNNAPQVVLHSTQLHLLNLFGWDGTS